MRTKHLVLVAGIVVSFLFAERAHAFVELNAFYYSETETAAATSNGSRMFLEGTLGFRIDKPGRYLVGWGIASHSHAATATTSSSYSSLQMGPRFLFMFNKEKAWSAGLAYYIVTKATFSDGSGDSETWKGTALHADFGYNMPLDEALYFSIRFNYSSASYTERLVGSATYSEVSYAKTYMYPSLAMFYVF